MAGMHRRTNRITAEAKRYRMRDRVIPDHGPPARYPWWLNDVEPRFRWAGGPYRAPQEFAKNPLTNFPSRPPHPWPTGVRWADMTPVVARGGWSEHRYLQGRGGRCAAPNPQLLSNTRTEAMT
jgi:hypothetical protein